MIRNLFFRVRNNEMINTSFYTGIGTAIGFVSNFVIQKVIAVMIGPSGVAMVSQFQNFIGIATSFATGGIQQGVVKYVAEERSDNLKQKLILSTSLRITLAFALLVGVITTFFSKKLSISLFGVEEYQLVLIIFGLTVSLFGLNNLLMSILNGTGEIKKLVAVKISSNLFGLFITASCTYFFGLIGALVALSISQSVIFCVSVIFVIKSDWFKTSLFKDRVNKEYSIKLFKYSLMALTSLVLPPLIQIGIRNHIVDSLSIAQAGYWDGLWKISNAYLGIITTTLAIYYLPKLSSLKERLEIRTELLNGFKIITPFLLILILIIYFLRDFVIVLLYSSEFIEMRNLFKAQLIGDFFKILSWLLANLMIAKAKTKMFVISQICFSFITYFLSIYLINFMGLEGVVWAHAIKFFIYFIVMLVLFRKFLIK